MLDLSIDFSNNYRVIGLFSLYEHHSPEFKLHINIAFQLLFFVEFLHIFNFVRIFVPKYFKSRVLTILRVIHALFLVSWRLLSFLLWAFGFFKMLSNLFVCKACIWGWLIKGVSIEFFIIGGWHRIKGIPFIHFRTFRIRQPIIFWVWCLKFFITQYIWHH